MHAHDRLTERVAPQDRVALEVALTALAARCKPYESVAVLCSSVPFTGPLWGEESNGDTLVAVIRCRLVTTVMLRRRSQPFTRDALSVDRVTKL